MSDRERQRFGELVREAGIPTDVPISRLPAEQQSRLGEIMVQAVRESGLPGLIDLSGEGIPMRGVTGSPKVEMLETPSAEEWAEELGSGDRPLLKRDGLKLTESLREAQAVALSAGVAAYLNSSPDYPVRVVDGDLRGALREAARQREEHAAASDRRGADGLLDLSGDGVKLREAGAEDPNAESSTHDRLKAILREMGHSDEEAERIASGARRVDAEGAGGAGAAEIHDLSGEQGVPTRSAA